MSEFNLNICALHESYRNNDCTPSELMRTLRKQALAQSEFNAWISVLSEEQLDEYCAQLSSSSIDELPLYGVPFAIKDNIDLAGIPTTAACPDFSYVPKANAVVVDVLIAAGAIPLGKTNLDQFATGLVGTRSPYGQGKNVFNQDYISGGSSAGSAIATALGQVSFALGTDTAGSGRVPAALNNLVGHKPSKGLLSTRGVVPACRTLDCVSIFALDSKDAATVLDVAVHFDPLDSYARENTYRNKSRYFSGTAPSQFQFGVPKTLDFQGDQECESMFKAAIDALEGMGGTAVAIDFSAFERAAKLLYEGPWVAERWLATKGVDLDSMESVIQYIVGNGNSASASDGFAAQYKLAECKRLADSEINDLDFVLTPTIPTVYTRAQIDAEPIKYNSILGTYTNFMNLLDYCATAVPVGPTSSGVHWGVTLFTHPMRDIELLNISAALQQHFAMPLGATTFAQSPQVSKASPLTAPSIDVVVCGAHLRGQPLNWQLQERGASFVEACQSSSNYKLYALADGIRPGMVRSETGSGANIAVEVWRVPEENFGSFVAGIPAPLGIGKVELEDGRWLSGFICDNYGLDGAKDITELGGWLAWLEQK